jgi:peptide/nickel transport system substrate-binding protein
MPEASTCVALLRGINVGGNQQARMADLRRGLWAAAALLLLAGCGAKPEAKTGTLVMIIESSPVNLDPRIGVDGQSERIDALIFDDLLTRDERLNVAPGLAERWELPDLRTYVFHLRRGVKFHDGRALTAKDVKWTFDSLLGGKIRTTKSAAYRYVERVEATDDFTVVFHMKEPDSALLWNLSDGAMGIVPEGSLAEMSARPVGSGPFQFVSAQLDKEVVLERNPEYWGGGPKIERVRFAVVPDMTTRALELRKGSADAAMNAMTGDMVLALEREQNLAVLHAPGTVLAYLGFNLRDPVLKDIRVRQALAYAIDRRPFIEYLQRGFARPAYGVLPPESWAYAEPNPAQYDPQRARQLLEQAGYAEKDGVRFHLTMKTSTDESTRLLAAVLQQQLREVQIALDIRSFEFATFFADVTRGLFQVYSLRWIGGNEDPDIFNIFNSARFPPNGTNRGFYSNPEVDRLLEQARREPEQQKRKELYGRVQQILSEQVPAINLWYFDNVLVHSRRVRNIQLNSAGNYDFLKTAELGAE